MTGMCGQHEGRLSVAIAGIRVCTPPKKIKDDLTSPRSTTQDLDALAIPDEQVWLSERQGYLCY
jgi:hypothetical protein